ncbi:MAG: single-stranded DNA-binding protein [Candidatus Sumerlaeaceae bacterium]
MLSINKVMVTGRLTRDPETRYLQSGTPVTNFSVAVNRRFLDPKTNEWRDETLFLDVEAWGKLAERCAEVLKKGIPVYVEGRLRADTWENREGQRQTRIRAVAERVSPFDVPSRGAESAPTELVGDYENNALPPTSGGPSAQLASRVATPLPASRQTGEGRPKSPTEGLAFDSPGDAPDVADDVPF